MLQSEENLSIAIHVAITAITTRFAVIDLLLLGGTIILFSFIRFW